MQINRSIAPLISNSSAKGLILLTGARQTGKTTLVKANYPWLPYFNLDAPEYREQLREVSSFAWERTVGNAIIDEIQKEPSLFDKIKFAYDEGKLRFTILTGSSQLVLLKKVKESLAGRVKLYELFPLMFSELIQPEVYPENPGFIQRIATSRSLDTLLEKLKPVILGPEHDKRSDAENWLLKWGGMPSLIHIQEEVGRRDWIRDYITTFIERDLADLVQLNNLVPFMRFQSLAALRASQLLNYSDLARDAALSVESVRRYLNYLQLSYQVFLLQPYHTNLTSRLVKTPKLFWFDNGTARQLASFGFESTNGQLFENYIGSELYKTIKTLRIDAQLYFYRTRSGMEIDFILETPNGVVAIDVKSRNQVILSDFTPIRKLQDHLKERFIGGMIVYRGNVIKSFGRNLWAFPSIRLLE
jgi:predicted AAA+ superfamily ATPase